MEHKRHYGIFEISPGRNPYEIRADGEGWFLSNELVDLAQQKWLGYSSIYAHDELTLTLTNASGDVTNARKYSYWWPLWEDWLKIDRGDLRTAGEHQSKELKGFILKPYVMWFDETTIREQFDFSPALTVEPSEWDFVKSADGLFTEMVHGKGAANVSTPPVFGELSETIVTFDPEHHCCPNLFFAVGFRRQAFDEFMLEAIDALADVEDTTTSHSFGTLIYFGGSPKGTVEAPEGVNGFRWRLVVPVKGKPYLQQGYYASQEASDLGRWYTREWTAGDLEAVDAGALAKEGKTYFIGVIGDCICISENRFEDNFAVYRCNKEAQPIIPKGGVRVYHWPGQCAVWIAPLGFARAERGYNALIYRRYIFTGNTLLDRIGPSRARVWCHTLKGYHDPTVDIWGPQPGWWPGPSEWADAQFWGTENYGTFIAPPVWPPHGPPGKWSVYPPYGWNESIGGRWPPDQDPPTAKGATRFHSGGDVTLHYNAPDHPALGNPQYLDWWVTATPSVWHISGQPDTFSSPFIMGVVIWQAPMITPNTPVWMEVATLSSLSMAEADLGSNGSCTGEVELVNPPNVDGTYPSDDVRVGSVCALTAASVLANNSVEYVTFGGMVLTEVKPEFGKVSCRFTDPLGMMERATWDRGDLDFRYWNPRGAIWSVMALYGMDTDLFFEDEAHTISTLEELGEYLDGDGWAFSTGTTIRSIVSEILTRGQRKAAIWWDPVAGKIRTGCQYCRTKRTGANWATHCNNGWRSTGCVAADVERAGETGVDHTIVVDTITGGILSMKFAEQFAGEQQKLTGGYVNRLMVEGRTFDGYPLRYQLQDDKSIGADASFDAERYVGWRVTKVVQVKGEGTWENLYQTMTDESVAFGERAWEVQGIPMPLNTSVRVGQVANVIGANWNRVNWQVTNVNTGEGKPKFRITGVKHDPNAGRTFVNIRQMIGPNDL